MPRSVLIIETRPDRRGPVSLGGYVYPADTLQVRTLPGPDGRLLREVRFVKWQTAQPETRVYSGALYLTSNTDAT